MRSLQVGGPMARREQVGNLSQASQRVTISARCALEISSSCIDLTDQVAQLPTQLCRTRDLGLTKGSLQQCPALGVVSSEIQEDLADRQRGPQKDENSPPPFSVFSGADQLFQVEAGILPSEGNKLHFDLDPR